ncbi:restriction endonuclease subunit S [Maribacter litopenaei]|uniref:Restriction endonuclease subunit S n=1 Tax=Maribacter litopenaei TaxID=2976127 RepID=A0ABY5Y5Q5_9FLAO|nr:restriction endonuclease subunit S [Maribacter litopenaei]UWX54343.1 restriction endonuclease subunit S [Maribacter litopenaei]
MGWIPENWDVGRISDYTSKIGSGSTPRGGSQIYVSSGVPFIRSQNVLNNSLLLDTDSLIPRGIHEMMKNTFVKPGDVLLNITGASIGRSCVVPKDFVEGNVNQHVCIVRTVKEKLNNHFLQIFLSSYSGQKSILTMQVGGNREGLNHSGVGSIKIPIPSLKEQKTIAQCLSTWDTAITKLGNLIKVKKKRKKGLMQQLLTGKKRLPGFDGEWEEVSLSNIAKRVTEKKYGAK